MLSTKRNKQAANHFFKKVLKNGYVKLPDSIHTDKNPAYVPAVYELKQEKILAESSRLRQVK